MISFILAATEIPRELSVPSGYFQLPIWVLVAITGIILSLIGYIWHRMEKQVDDVRTDLEDHKAKVTERDEKLAVLQTQMDTIGTQTIKRDETQKLINEKFTKSDQQISVNTNRLDRLIADWDASNRDELARGGFVTMDKLNDITSKIVDDLTKVMSEKIGSIEKNLSLQMENMRLSIIANGNGKKKKNNGRQ